MCCKIGEIKVKAGRSHLRAASGAADFAAHLQTQPRADQGRILARHLPRNHVQRAVAGKVTDHRLPRPGGDLHPSGRRADASAPACATPPNKTIADIFTEVGKKPRRLRGGAGGKLDRRGGDAHAGHVCGEQPAHRGADRLAHPVLPGGPGARSRTCSASTSIRRRWPNAASGCSATCPRRKFWKLPPTPVPPNWRPPTGSRIARAKSPPSPACWRPRNTI